MELKNNTVLITGGSSGIGLELAQRLTEYGNQVLICGRNEQKLDQVKRNFPAIEVLKCDLSKVEECIRLANWVGEKHPDCNMLINNAALVHSEDFINGEQMIEKANLEFQTNLLAPITLAKLLMPVLRKNANSAIINVTTGLVYAPKAVYPFYNASKAALHSFTQMLRIQAQGSGVKIIEAQFPAVDTPWHKGNVPKVAIPAKEAVQEMITGLEKDRDEIRIGKVKLIYWMSRIAPGFALRTINSLK